MATTHVYYTHGLSKVEVATYFDGENTTAPFAPNYNKPWKLEEIEADLQKEYPGQKIVIHEML